MWPSDMMALCYIHFMRKMICWLCAFQWKWISIYIYRIYSLCEMHISFLVPNNRRTASFDTLSICFSLSLALSFSLYLSFALILLQPIIQTLFNLIPSSRSLHVSLSLSLSLLPSLFLYQFHKICKSNMNVYL